MPAPQASLLENILKGNLSQVQVQGKNAPDLAKAIAKTTATALSMFVAMAMVMPGIAAALDPITGSGATSAPGKLMPPPVGAPMAAQILPLALADLQSNGIRGKNASDLAKVVADSIAIAIQMFTAQAMVMPGMAIAGFVTTAPGNLS